MAEDDQRLNGGGAHAFEFAPGDAAGLNWLIEQSIRRIQLVLLPVVEAAAERIQTTEPTNVPAEGRARLDRQGDEWLVAGGGRLIDILSENWVGVLRQEILDISGFSEDMLAHDASGAIGILSKCVRIVLRLIELRDEKLPPEDDTLLNMFAGLAVEFLRYERPLAYDPLEMSTNFRSRERGCPPAVARLLAALAPAGDAAKKTVVTTMLLEAAAAPSKSALLSLFDEAEKTIEVLRGGTLVPAALVTQFARALAGRAETRLLVASLGIAVPEVFPIATNTMKSAILRDRILAATAESDVVSKTLEFEVEIEHARQRLVDIGSPSLGPFNWLDWSFDHPVLMEVVPTSVSLTREDNGEELLLEIAHEVTHAFSLLGGLGAYSHALLRVIAALEPYLRPRDADRRTPAPMADGMLPWRQPSLPRLHCLDRIVELLRKVQIFHDIWTPWLEGVALYAEVAADPALDESVLSPIGEAVRGLFDAFGALADEIDEAPPAPAARGEAHARNVQDRLLEHARQAAGYHSGAMAKQGRRRLRHYLDMEGAPYLPGYIAVRAVVSAWRKTLGRRLSAAEASQILLHATRYGLWDLLPDASLSLEAFGEACRCGLRDFIRRLVRLEAGSLGHFRPGASGQVLPLAWIGNSVVEGGSGGVLADAPIAKAIEQCLGTLCRGQDDHLRAVEVTLRELLNVLVSNVHSLTGINSIIPVASTRSKFWMDLNGRLKVLIRSNYRNAETGNASHNYFDFSIEKEELAELVGAYEKLRDPRLRVLRVIDLSTRGGQLPVAGNNYLAFVYGDWVHIQSAGLLAGAAEPIEPGELAAYEHNLDYIGRAILTRFNHPPSFLRFMRLVTEHPQSLSERINAFLTEAEGAQPRTPSLTSLINHVRALCVEFDGEPRLQCRRGAAQTIVEEALGDARLAARLASEGLSKMLSRMPASRADYVVALNRTAALPEEIPDFDTIAADADALQCRLLTRTPLGWDVPPHVGLFPNGGG